MLPLAYAFALPHRGFGAYPHEPGYSDGPRDWAAAAASSYYYAGARRGAHRTILRVRGRKRLGWNAAFSGFASGVFDGARQSGLHAVHVTANYVQTDTALLEAGFGGMTFQDPASRWGPSMELDLELFLHRPLTVELRWQAGLARGQGYHDLSAGAGAAWRWFGLEAGWRVVVTPRKTLSGPTVALRGWF